MAYESIDPLTGERWARYPDTPRSQIVARLDEMGRAAAGWQALDVQARADILARAESLLETRKNDLSLLMAREMGKHLREGAAEINKCRALLRYYRDNAARQLADEPLPVGGDQNDSNSRRACLTYQPLGGVFAIMPWNFPFWQAVRAVAPALIAGNTVMLKHASSVPQCSLALEQILHQAGVPRNVYAQVFASLDDMETIVAHPAISGVTLTGSERAGSSLASLAGKHLKRQVLELGGSDAFIVLEDADLETTAREAAKARMINGGQSCIAAKRFIVVEAVAEAFARQLTEAMAGVIVGNPLSPDVDHGPMARADLARELHEQVQTSLRQGARLRVGGGPPVDSRLEPTVLDHVRPGMVAFDEELFGPVAAIVRAGSDREAVALANASPYGLGGSVWTRDIARGEALARQLQCGMATVNERVQSEPGLPFGGVGRSGYGRELAHLGLRAFCNEKTLVVGG